MVSYSTSDFKVGLKIIIDNDPCVIIEEEFNKPGKGRLLVKLSLETSLQEGLEKKLVKLGNLLRQQILRN